MVYKKEEQGRRLAYLFSSVALAGMFGGLIATAITYMGNLHGVESWSWLYIIEGCISILVSFWVFFGLPPNPTEPKFLTAKDKDVMVIREAQRAHTLQAQYLSVPVYLLGGISFFITVQTATVLGDKWKVRGTVLFTLDIFAVIGYAILLAVPDIPGIGYLYILNRKKFQIAQAERSGDRKETTGEGDLDFSVPDIEHIHNPSNWM
ncbi:hypothetical protein FJTKL_13308 [Diaporthe vaccinii]|uniref:Major facilitator superfamily (MFS) profile domain-containing protein n=1 Tax=Diaporthe vaccinii TaxID=105482 RepID=A0ABR4EB05_9PEZI